MGTATEPKIHLPAPNPLLDAEQILRTDGWITGSMKCDDGKRCAVGAVRAACGLRERTESPGRFLNATYVRSLEALATAINPAFRTSKVMTALLRNIYGPGDSPRFADLLASQQVDAMEQFIIDYNDGRVQSLQGRNAVLNRFAKAAAAYEA